MKLINISSHALAENKTQFESFVNNCDYYAVSLPSNKSGNRYFTLFSGDIKTNIRVVRLEELKYFMLSSKMIIQDCDNFGMNFDGK